MICLWLHNLPVCHCISTGNWNCWFVSLVFVRKKQCWRFGFCYRVII